MARAVAKLNPAIPVAVEGAGAGRGGAREKPEPRAEDDEAGAGAVEEEEGPENANEGFAVPAAAVVAVVAAAGLIGSIALAVGLLELALVLGDASAFVSFPTAPPTAPPPSAATCLR